MSKMVQIRNMPERLHRTLKARAAEAGLSLSDYLLGELRDGAARPTPEQMRERLERRSRILEGESSADAVHAVRGAR
jgi:plasmid stability protein